MKTPNPDKDGRCVCFAHSEDECQCGAWHKPAPMVWHKLSEKTPTEKGFYVFWNGYELSKYFICGCCIASHIENMFFCGFTHWCLITPPEDK